MTGTANPDRDAFKRRFGAMIRKQREACGMTREMVAANCNIYERSLWAIETGRTLCDYRVAADLCDFIGARAAMAEMVEFRTKVCDVCGKQFLDTTNRTDLKRSCSSACRTIDNQRKVREENRKRANRAVAQARGEAQMLRSRFTVYVAAVEAMCKSCEPEGICRTTSCELRTVSPLPISARRSA